MEMEIDETSTPPPPPVSNQNALFLCSISKKGGLKKAKIHVETLNDISLETLKGSVMKELNKWDWEESDDIPTHFDLLHCSRILKTDEDVKKVRPLSVITILNKDRMGVNPLEEKHKEESFIATYAKSRNIHEQVRSCSLALKTAFLNPKFVSMVENLADSDMLENVFAVVPELKHDPVAVGIIQDPSLIFHLSDPESLKKLANTKPWIIEAFNFISASIHQEKGAGPSSQGIGHLFGSGGLFDGEDESMEEDDDDAPGPSARGSVITREQLSAALSALGGGRGLGAATANAFGGLFRPPTTTASQPPQSQQPAAASNPNAGVARAGANIQNLMNTLAGAAGATPGQPLNSDMVARAVTDALRRLTPEQRADQMNAIRNFATQLQQQSGAAAATPSQPTPAPQRSPAPPAAAAPSQQPQAAGGGASTLAQLYASQLRQMRDLGITDERLSILALRVSEGDVNTAAELIFSGWQGEGSDPI